MKKSYLLAVGLVAILLILLSASFWYLQSTKSGTITANKEVVPSVSTNPLDNKPDINPADQANPYKNIKTNPFE